MRLFRVTGENKSDSQLAVVTSGKKGPGIYAGSFHLPVDGNLALPFQGESANALTLAAARLSEKDGKPVLLPAPKSLLLQVRKSLAGERQGRYYGPALVHLDLSCGPVELFTTDFATDTEEYSPGKERVIRKYLELVGVTGTVQTAGVEPLHLEKDQTKGLLTLLPGAAFRVHGADGAVMLVSWTGLELYVTYPTRAQAARKSKGLATMGEVIKLHQHA
jgi:hypothetical protein